MEGDGWLLHAASAASFYDHHGIGVDRYHRDISSVHSSTMGMRREYIPGGEPCQSSEGFRSGRRAGGMINTMSSSREVTVPLILVFSRAHPRRKCLWRIPGSGMVLKGSPPGKGPAILAKAARV
jgi:hypothetical protein